MIRADSPLRPSCIATISLRSRRVAELSHSEPWSEHTHPFPIARSPDQLLLFQNVVRRDVRLCPLRADISQLGRSAPPPTSNTPKSQSPFRAARCSALRQSCCDSSCVCLPVKSSEECRHTMERIWWRAKELFLDASNALSASNKTTSSKEEKLQDKSRVEQDNNREGEGRVQKVKGGCQNQELLPCRPALRRRCIHGQKECAPVVCGCSCSRCWWDLSSASQRVRLRAPAEKP